MKTSRIPNLNLFLSSILFLAVACDDEDAGTYPTGPYIPLEAGTMWTYKSYHDCNCEEMDYYSFGDNSYKMTGDTIIDGRVYQKMNIIESQFTFPVRFIRQEGAKYYEYLYNGDEKIILDTSVSPGHLFYRENSDYRTIEIRLMKRLAVKKVEGRIYRDVIHVRESVTYNWPGYETWVFTDYYYAKGVGEIFQQHEVNPEKPIYDSNYHLTLTAHEKP